VEDPFEQQSGLAQRGHGPRMLVAFLQQLVNPRLQFCVGRLLAHPRHEDTPLV
jgi:hypothetical protein